MLTKRSKRFMAVLFTTIMTIGSVTSAFASEASPTDPTVAMLSNYDTPYTTVITADPEQKTTVELKVTGLDAAYHRVPLNQKDAEDVTWAIKDGGTIIPSSIEFEADGNETDGYVSVATVTIPKGNAYGYAIAEAKLGTLPAFDLVIAVNPQGNATAVSNIQVKIKNGDNVVSENTIATLGDNTQFTATEVKYPTALSAVLALQDDQNTGITNVAASGGYLTSLSVNGTPYPTNSGYWTYTVSTNAGAEYEQSEIVGAGAFQLHDGDVVTWTCVQ